MMRDYPYDAKHFARVPAPGHGASIHRSACQHPACARGEGPEHSGRPPRRAKDGTLDAGTNAESVWRESVGLPR